VTCRKRRLLPRDARGQGTQKPTWRPWKTGRAGVCCAGTCSAAAGDVGRGARGAIRLVSRDMSAATCAATCPSMPYVRGHVVGHGLQTSPRLANGCRPSGPDHPSVTTPVVRPYGIRRPWELCLDFFFMTRKEGSFVLDWARHSLVWTDRQSNAIARPPTQRNNTGRRVACKLQCTRTLFRGEKGLLLATKLKGSMHACIDREASK